MESWDMIMEQSCLSWKPMQMTGKIVNIATVFFTGTGSAAVEPTVERIPIVQIAMKRIIVPTVETALIILMICVKTAVSV